MKIIRITQYPQSQYYALGETRVHPDLTNPIDVRYEIVGLTTKQLMQLLDGDVSDIEIVEEKTYRDLDDGEYRGHTFK